MSERKWARQENDVPVAGDADTFVLLPVVGEPGAYVAVFADGSYVRDWIPAVDN